MSKTPNEKAKFLPAGAADAAGHMAAFTFFPWLMLGHKSFAESLKMTNLVHSIGLQSAILGVYGFLCLYVLPKLLRRFEKTAPEKHSLSDTAPKFLPAHTAEALIPMIAFAGFPWIMHSGELLAKDIFQVKDANGILGSQMLLNCIFACVAMYFLAEVIKRYEKPAKGENAPGAAGKQKKSETAAWMTPTLAFAGFPWLIWGVDTLADKFDITQLKDHLGLQSGFNGVYAFVFMFLLGVGINWLASPKPQQAGYSEVNPTDNPAGDELEEAEGEGHSDTERITKK